MVMIAFVGVATFDNPGKGATSIPHWLLLALITLLAQLRGRQLGAHTRLSACGDDLQDPRHTRVSLPIAVVTVGRRAPFVRSCEAGEGSLLLLLPTPARSLYTQVTAQKA
jgi:hypothetical protein